MIGQIFAHYRILEKLGAGGMGEVYLALDMKLERKVALKFLPPHFSADPEFKSRFQHEAKATAALDHPNIISVHELGEYEGRLYIAMQHAKGQTLQEMIASGKLALNQSLEIARQVCEGLAEAHKAGIVHRDIKPANILFTDDGIAKILDFGLAKSHRATTETKVGSTLGTVQYESPEQSRGEEVDGRSDLFSVGVLLYEMITGKLPFTGEYDESVRYAISHEEAQPIARFASGVNDEVQRIVSKLLEKDREVRYQNAEGVLSDLRLLARSDSGVSPAAESNKSRWLVMVGALVVVSVVVVAALKYWPGADSVSSDSVLDTRKMLVVLPFENLGSPDDEYFADGITDEITSNLAKVSGLGIISRASAIHYKKTSKGLPQIAEELGVDFVLEGTIRWDKTGEVHLVRITPQLIRVSDDTHLWAENYERELKAVFEVQKDIASRIVDALDITLLGAELRALDEKPTDDLEAYDYYLRGNEFYNRGYAVQGPYRAAAILFEKAVEYDTAFAKCYSRLSQVYTELYWHHGKNDSDFAKSERALKRVEELGYEGADYRTAAGSYYYHLGDYDRALVELKAALEKEPGNAETFTELGFTLRRQGKYDEAIENFKIADALNPFYWDNRMSLGDSYLWAHRYDEAEAAQSPLNVSQPDRSELYSRSAWLKIMRNGDFDQARRILDDIPSGIAPTPWKRYLRAWVYLSAGEHEKALKMYEIEDPATPGSDIYYQAAVYDMLGQSESARRYYDSARVVIKRLLDSGKSGPQYRIGLGISLAGLGRKADAIREGKLAVETQGVTYPSPGQPSYRNELALIYVMVDELDAAVEQLDRVLSAPSEISPASLRVNPFWEKLRGYPGFEALLKKYEEKDS